MSNVPFSFRDVSKMFLNGRATLLQNVIRTGSIGRWDRRWNNWVPAKCLFVNPEVVLAEGAEDHFITRPMPLQFLVHGSQRDRAGRGRGIEVGPGADAGEGDRARPWSRRIARLLR